MTAIWRLEGEYMWTECTSEEVRAGVGNGELGTKKQISNRRRPTSLPCLLLRQGVWVN